jgi:hypothetical protein
MSQTLISPYFPKSKQQSIYIPRHSRYKAMYLKRDDCSSSILLEVLIYSIILAEGSESFHKKSVHQPQSENNILLCPLTSYKNSKSEVTIL